MKIVCENARGETMEFSYDTDPIKLSKTDGFSAADFEVMTTRVSGQDGESFSGSTANKRNAVITVEIFSDYQAQRDKLFSFFQPRSQGTLYCYNGDAGKKAGYYVEKVDIGESGAVRIGTISLICPDPKFYDLSDTLTQLAVWKGKITFPLRFSNTFSVTDKVNTLIANVYNPGALEMGLTVKFTASGTVVNPSLYDVNRQELMKVNITMTAGDVIVITTGFGNKRIQLIRGGVVTNIANLMNYPPKWLQAYQGDNLFRYDADSGIEQLSVSILTTKAYWGA